jgi:hypothetical protein
VQVFDVAVEYFSKRPFFECPIQEGPTGGGFMRSETTGNRAKSSDNHRKEGDDRASERQ